MKSLLAVLFILLCCCCKTETGEQQAIIPPDPSFKPAASVQSDNSLVLPLSQMKTDTLDIHAEAYWKLVHTGISAVPVLIEKLTDTTITTIRHHCKNGGRLNIGEVCYFALQEIIDLPAALVTGYQFDVIHNNCWSFYDYFYNNVNKTEYQEKVRIFYLKNKFRFVDYTKVEQNDCHRHYKIHGKYKLAE